MERRGEKGQWILWVLIPSEWGIEAMALMGSDSERREEEGQWLLWALIPPSASSNIYGTIWYMNINNKLSSFYHISNV